MTSLFDKRDIQQIEARGIKLDTAIAQVETLKRGLQYAELDRACTVGDGIAVIDKGDLERLGEIHSQAASSGRVTKFVPASGAASRMFQGLISLRSRPDLIEGKPELSKIGLQDPDYRVLLQFTEGLKRFPFYGGLRLALSKDGLDLEALTTRGQFREILDYLLTPKGLGYGNLPKGLIEFHRYDDRCRTAFEEHLAEAAAYARDRNGVARLHFTVSPGIEESIEKHLSEVRGYHERSGVRYEVALSVQKPSTDTLTLGSDNQPFRERDGTLLFRPGGHGALLENLNELGGDIVFIKNIDNVVPDRLKGETSTYKKALGGLLLSLQGEIHGHLDGLSKGTPNERVLQKAFEFARTKLSIVPPCGIEKGSAKERARFLLARLNRPVRVCGMVKAQGEPGGGPFWVKDADGGASLQIIEASQVRMQAPEQQKIFLSSTHFNPVDLVCGVRDHLERPFHLMDFSDPNSCFISTKSKDGKEIKALELPGLWNGGMANWNTVFVEVPITTFNPVKTVFDLLRSEHQPG